VRLLAASMGDKVSGLIDCTSKQNPRI